MKQRIILPKSHLLPERSRLLLGQLAEQFDLELLETIKADELAAGDLVVDDKDLQLKLFWQSDAPLFSFSLVDQYSFHQKKKYSLKSEPLARALGTKYLQDLLVLDATCGTGRDLCLMLSFGVQKLTAYERHPLVYCLLKYQWQQLQELLPKRELELKFGSVEALEDPSSTLIYFDPMYPEKKKKSSLSRKEMEYFKILVGEDGDAEDFLGHLFSLKPKRLVAKRPLKASAWKIKATDSFSGKSTRYDLFVP